jgi:anaerobic ribonucleoside-triphosphate reductase activating protein
MLALGGRVPFSTVDFPGKLSAVLFTQGCPLRCRYCHNPHLQPRIAGTEADWAATISWLRTRQGLLDAVVISGGEPTIQAGLSAAIREIREMGFTIGLHSAGAQPQRLAQVLPLVDWVGLDIKAPFDRYEAITGNPASGMQAQRALDAVMESGVDHEIRTTVHGDLLGPDDLKVIATELKARNAARWAIQMFRPMGCQDPTLGAGTTPEWLDELLPTLRDMLPDVIVRGGSDSRSSKSAPGI